MGIAFRYVSSELLAVFLVTAVVLLLIALGGRFMTYLQGAALGEYAPDALLWIMVLRISELLQMTAPFAFFIALVTTTARLYADQEMTVLATSGASPGQVLGWIAVSAIVVAGGVAYLAIDLTPRTNVALQRFLLSQRANREFESLTPGVFHTGDAGNRVIYAHGLSADKRELARVFVAQQDAARTITIWAERGSQYLSPTTGSRFLELYAGRRYEGAVGRLPYRVVTFAALRQRVARQSETLGRLAIDAQPTAQLRRDEPRGRAEFHWRLALPLMTLIAVPMGFGLSRVRPSEGRFARIVPAVLAFLLYYWMLLLNRTALADGQLPDRAGMWGVHAVFLVFALVLLRRMNRPLVTA